jgi:hypothetical protein
MVTYYLIHTVKRTVLLETTCPYLLRAYIDQKVSIDMIPQVSVVIDDATD